MTTLGGDLGVLARGYGGRSWAGGRCLELGRGKRVLLLLLFPAGFIAARFRIQGRPDPLLRIVGGGGLFEGVNMLGGATRGCVGSRGAGGFGLLLFPVRSVSAFRFFALFLLLKLFFLQTFSFCIVRLALGTLLANELNLSAGSVPLTNMGYPRSQNRRQNSFHAS